MLKIDPILHKMKETSKIENIFHKNHKLKSIFELSEQHAEIHKIISKSFSQYIDFHILLDEKSLTIKVENANNWHVLHFAQNQIKRNLNDSGFNIETITVSKSFSKI